METYRDDLLGLSFSYPIGWTLDASDPTLVTLDPGLGGVVRIGISLAGPTTLDDQLAQQLRDLEQLPVFRELSTVIRNGEGLHYVTRGEWTSGDTAIQRATSPLEWWEPWSSPCLPPHRQRPSSCKRKTSTELAASFKVSAEERYPGSGHRRPGGRASGHHRGQDRQPFAG